MITSPAWAGKRYAVLGLARSGAATVAALLASGAEVVAWDEDEAKRDALPLPARGERVGMRGATPDAGAPPDTAADPSAQPSPRRGEGAALCFADPLALDLAGFAGVVVSPGVPLNRHPIAAHAAAAGVPVIGDVELFAQARASLPPHRVVGITGTNGKSTTTALVHHILQTAGVPSLMGGNIGLPILSREPLPEGGVYVLELSSYQLDLTFTLDCDVAVLTNITPDHLDRYADFAAYAASKARLFEMQGSNSRAVFGDTDETTLTLGQNVDKARPSGVYIPAAWSFVGQSAWPSLQGRHNLQNAAIAATVTALLGIGHDKVQEGLRTYAGLPHRMERVAEREGVLFVNDSKATNATAAAPALAAFPPHPHRNIHWILGGRAKGDALDACAPFFNHVRAAYTIGEAGPRFARLLGAAGVAVTESGTLDKAVQGAAAAAAAGEVVLLSPACASFDQFTDFEARGEAFRAAVAAL